MNHDICHNMKIKLLSISFAILVCCSIHAQNQQELNNRFAIAQNYEINGQFEKAEEIYRELFAQQNMNHLFFEALNKILVSQKKYDESIELVENRIKLNPQDVNLYGLLGNTYYMMDEVPIAFEAWERGINTNKNSVIVYRVIANYAIQNRAFEKAIEILERGKNITDDPLIFSYDLANIYSINMRFEDAAKEYSQIVVHKPDQVGSVKQRIFSYISRQGAEEPTIKTIEQIVKNNSLPELLDLLTYVYISTNNYEKAFATAVEYDKKNNSAGNYVFVFAQDSYRNRKYEIASKAYEYVFNNHPSSQLVPTAKIGYANTLEAACNEDYLRQIQTWKPLKKKEPVLTERYLSIIKAYEKLAIEYPNGTVYSEAIFKMGEIYFQKLYEFMKADSLFEKINQRQLGSNYSFMAFLQRAKIAVINNEIEKAENFLKSVSVRRQREFSLEADYYLAKIEFWKGNFESSLKLFRKVTSDLSTDFANDALELSAIINSTKRDSINLSLYAKADLLVIQNKLEEAVVEFKTLADNPNLFLINEFAKYRLAEVFLAEDKNNLAVEILEEIANNSNASIFDDKSTFLLAKTYHFALNYKDKAIENYQKLLEKFPNSLYFDIARDYLNHL